MKIWVKFVYGSTFQKAPSFAISWLRACSSLRFSQRWKSVPSCKILQFKHCLKVYLKLINYENKRLKSNASSALGYIKNDCRNRIKLSPSLLSDTFCFGSHSGSFFSVVLTAKSIIRCIRLEPGTNLNWFEAQNAKLGQKPYTVNWDFRDASRRSPYVFFREKLRFRQQGKKRYDFETALGRKLNFRN